MIAIVTIDPVMDLEIGKPEMALYKAELLRDYAEQGILALIPKVELPWAIDAEVARAVRTERGEP